mgnify:CR=1 FL=1
MVRENTRNISNSIEEQNELLKKQSRKIEAKRKKSEQIADIKNTLKNTIKEEKAQYNLKKIDFLNVSMRDKITQLVLQLTYSENHSEIVDICDQYYLSAVSDVFKLEEAEAKEAKKLEKENKHIEEAGTGAGKDAIWEAVKIVLIFFGFLLAFPIAVAIAAMKCQK